MRSVFSILFLIGLVLTPVVRAQTEKVDDLPDQLDLQDFPGVFIDEVIVPNPAEIFNLMEKLGQPNWAGKVRRNFKIQKSTDRIDLALLFGTLIADGFIAVQARDSEAVTKLGQEILELSKALALEDAVLPHAQAILESTEDKKWGKVREELDRTHKTVRETMERRRAGELAQCVSIAGWLRGTEVLTSLIIESYSTDKAEILNQPDLAAHFVKQIEAMDPEIANEPAVQRVLEGLRKVQALMADHDNEVLPSNEVDEIHTICAAILELIVKSES
ncbi:MAG: hypothetical protein ACI8UO_001263 [Verrucomicrobiales bacterium]|jgi:hypothetical protein